MNLDLRRVVRDLLADPVYQLLISPENRALLTRTGYPHDPPPLADLPTLDTLSALPVHPYRFGDDLE